jgi:hypothetical protein
MTKELSMNNVIDKETELKIACAKLQLLIALGKAQPTQNAIDRKWIVMSLTSAQKRNRIK